VLAGKQMCTLAGPQACTHECSMLAPTHIVCTHDRAHIAHMLMHAHTHRHVGEYAWANTKYVNILLMLGRNHQAWSSLKARVTATLWGHRIFCNCTHTRSQQGHQWNTPSRPLLPNPTMLHQTIMQVRLKS